MATEFASLHAWYEQERKVSTDQEIVEKLINRLGVESNNEVVRFFKFVLADEFRRQQRYHEAEATLLDLSNNRPTEPIPLIQLAEQKLYMEQKPDDALAVVEKALERAYASGNYRRHALGVKARIAARLRRYELVEDVLKKLMAIELNETNADVGIERDFVNSIPPTAIDAELLKQYDKFCHRDNSS